MHRTATSISVVVPAHNESQWIHKLIHAIARQTVLPQELIIVDNASTDGTAQVARTISHKYPQLRVKIVRESRLGLGRARNTGIRAAKGQIIAGTDADCQPHQTWIETIDRHFSHHSDHIALSGSLIWNDGPKVIHKLSEMKILQMYFHLIKWYTGVALLPGGNSAFKKSAWKKAGGYDEDRQTANSLEDLEFSARLSKLGKIVFLSDMVVNTSYRRLASNKQAIETMKVRAKETVAVLQTHRKHKPWWIFSHSH